MGGTLNNQAHMGNLSGLNISCDANAQHKPAFNAETAMYALGKADAESVQ